MADNTIKLERKAGAGDISFRKPTKSDGSDVWRLIADSGKLDENSMYCNLLQCDHFADTCVLAELDGEIVGWISGYLPPDDDKTFFVWQVAVSEKARGRGIAKKMLRELMRREDCAQVEQLQTTITKDNDASWALFRSFARFCGATIKDQPHFREEEHFDGEHDTEHMVTITFEAAVKIAFAA
ncbi:diaminobutyrate acetyltransferase [Pararhizobium haloflavum]|uniref:diaminobutyrate acetyltransferase n=1 Tax=Pararhizobium haloflavum TaxID=2037914 RepID=UPI000C1977E9|nr:diaminobutyrate acetyltransferase [Pararhizobium haloflavum]